MIIGGFEKFSMLDYPDGKLTAIVFTAGCNMNCPYCHNAQLVGKCENRFSQAEVINSLSQRKHFLDAVTITGGEPTLQPDLEEFIEEIKAMGYLVKLDTNGTRPEVIRSLIEKGLLDYIAMDIKSSFKKYKMFTSNADDIDNAFRSIDIILKSNVKHEFRTTVVDDLIDGEDIGEITGLIQGKETYYVQKFKSSNTLDPEYRKKTSLSDTELFRIKSKYEKRLELFAIR